MQYNFKTLEEGGVTGGAVDVRGKRVLIRLDLNVPVADGKVMDDYRIRQAVPTVKWLCERKAKVIIVAHLQNFDTKSLRAVCEVMNTYVRVRFVPESFTAKGFNLDGITEGEAVMLENIRNYEGEETNDLAFAQTLASLGDIYVNEAFSVSHRAHASVVGVPKLLPSFAGPRFTQEVRALSEVFSPAHPFLFILGGAKIDTKLPLLRKFLNIADTVYVGGVLANDCFKAKGWKVGKSAVSPDAGDLSDLISNPKIMLPRDVIVENAGGISAVKSSPGVASLEAIYDAGPASLIELRKVIAGAKTILWNGPLGHYEKGYKSRTLELAQIIAGSGARTVVGGGDTLAAIAELKLEDKFTFVSTAGGAMLDFLANETLPGLQALET